MSTPSPRSSTTLTSTRHSGGQSAPWPRRSVVRRGIAAVRRRDQTALRLRIRELAHARPRFGFLRIWVLLRREGWPVNKKRVRRLYRLDGLQLRMRVRRRKHIALAPRAGAGAGRPDRALEHGLRP